MLIKRLLSKMTAIVLVVATLFAFVVPKQQKNEEVLRTINIDNIAVMSYEEKMEEILNHFDSYSGTYEEENDLLCFSAQMTMSADQIKGLDFVSSYNDEVIKKYETALNPETMEFTIFVKYYQNEKLIQEETVETVPYYVELEDDWKVEINNEVVSIKGILENQTMENCIAATIAVAAITATAGSALLLATVVACAPLIEKVVTTIVQQVVSVLKSFFRWVKSLFVTTTITTTVETYNYKYRVEIGGKEYVLSKVDGSRKFEEGKYYIALADTESGFVYISDLAISRMEAVSVLASGVKIPAISGSQLSFVLSTYTFLEPDAFSIAESAAIALGGSGVTKHQYHDQDRNGNVKVGTYFKHYHPLYPYVHGTAHSFYDTPVIHT